MTFPTVTTGSDNSGSNTTSYVAALPDNLQVGDIVIVSVAKDGGAAITWPSDPAWGTLGTDGDNVNTMFSAVRWRRIDGTEGWGGAGNSITLTSSSEGWAHAWMRIVGAHPTTDPEATGGANGADANPDPPSLTPTWSGDDTLFIVTYGWDGNQSHVAYPANYDDNQTTSRWANTAGIGIALATRDLLASGAEDPGTGTISSTEQWRAYTIAVLGADVVIEADVSHGLVLGHEASALLTEPVEADIAHGLVLGHQVAGELSTPVDASITHGLVLGHQVSAAITEPELGLPANEVIFDRDGSAMILTDPNSVPLADISSSAASLRALDQDNAQTWNDPQGAIVYLFFPQPVDLAAVLPWQPTGQSNPKCHFSTNATAPGDGDWFDWSTGMAQAATTATTGTNLPNLITANIGNDPSVIPPIHESAVGVTAVRFRISSAAGSTRRYINMRIWGTPSNPASYLALWHPTLNRPADFFDLGAIPQGGTTTADFRVKNLHPTAQVNNITLSTPDGAGLNDPHTHIDFDDGGGFANPLDIGSLVAEQVSGVITLRRVVGGGEEITWGLATLLVEGTWSP